jgi:enoyl-CoA hydratase
LSGAKPPGEEHLEVEAKDGVLRVCIDRPEKRNALSRDVLRGIAAAFARHGEDERLKAAVLTGAGDKSFAAGGDLVDLASIRTLEGAAKMADDAKAALDAIRRFPVPVIAALNGDAMGGGAELAMACDFRVAARHARIGFVQGRLNVSTAWGGGIDLMHVVGTGAALRILCRSELFAPDEAKALGLIDAAAGPGQPLADRVAEFLAPLLGQAPQVLRAFKGLAHGVRTGRSRAELDALETRLFARTWVHDDHWAAAEKILDRTPR